MKEGDALLSLLFNTDSGYAIGNVQEEPARLNRNGAHQLLI